MYLAICCRPSLEPGPSRPRSCFRPPPSPSLRESSKKIRLIRRRKDSDNAVFHPPVPSVTFQSVLNICYIIPGASYSVAARASAILIPSHSSLDLFHLFLSLSRSFFPSPSSLPLSPPPHLLSWRHRSGEEKKFPTLESVGKVNGGSASTQQVYKKYIGSSDDPQGRKTWG